MRSAAADPSTSRRPLALLDNGLAAMVAQRSITAAQQELLISAATDPKQTLSIAGPFEVFPVA